MLSPLALLLLYPLVVLSSHRLWNRERIFASGRHLVSRVPGLNCEECNIFWIALVWALALPLVQIRPEAVAFYLAASVYAPIRFAMLGYRFLDPPPAPAKKCPSCGQQTPPQEKAAKRPKHLALFVGRQTWAHDDAVIAGLMVKIGGLIKTGQWYIKVLVPAGTDMPSIAAYYLDIQKALNIPVHDFIDTVTLPEEVPVGQLQKHLMLMGNGILLAIDEVGEGQRDSLEKAGTIRGFRTIYIKPLDCAETPYDQFIAWVDTQWSEAVTRKT
jgi:hypothetical protein